jgi:cytochrome P450
MTVCSAREDVMLGGYRIPAGTEVFLTQWLLHRDAAYYPAPMKFDPSRWTDPKTADRLEREGRYAPFWFGRKKCIGYQYAAMEATLVLATLLRSHEMELQQDDIQVIPGMVLHPKELRVRVRARRQPN